MGLLVDVNAPEMVVMGVKLRLTPTGRYLLGLVFLMGVVFIWVGVSELMQVRRLSLAFCSLIDPIAL